MPEALRDSPAMTCRVGCWLLSQPNLLVLSCPVPENADPRVPGRSISAGRVGC